MNQFIINKTMSFIKNNTNKEEQELIKIKYGLEGVYLTITKGIIILLIALITNTLFLVLLTLLFFNILRFFAFGLHAKKSWQCLVLSIIEFNILPIIMSHITLTNYICLTIFILSFISFLLFAPSDTEKRPLTNKKKRIIRKIISLVVLSILFIISLYIKILLIPIICSFIIESILINPITYKLLNLNYKNYSRL